ncbi:hypothetical protein [Commensalibacter papalotli (ex Servin-Garciduenas et al. 2014)]|nr:hypothetical protein [Commensalibacter papalotli (ex Servin-Garciduenas et al. 2014)]
MIQKNKVINADQLKAVHQKAADEGDSEALFILSFFYEIFKE